jgi:HAD superfamily hydrolase (TIGR01509 family)
MQYSTLIFDLSEVLIRGFLGVERTLTHVLRASEGQIVRAFGGEMLIALCKGQISEDEYWTTVLKAYHWDVALEDVKAYIRANFQQTVPGMVELVSELSRSYRLVILSDHAREWVEYIVDYHHFLDLFAVKLFSYELGSVKSEPETFEKALARIATRPEDCLFIDDNQLNIATAKMVGLFGLHFTHTGALVKQLRQRDILTSYYAEPSTC